jgi:hypothetical protein
MSNTNNSNIIHKITCYAIGCNQNAETNVKVKLEKKEMILFFCNDCLVKFRNYNKRWHDNDNNNDYSQYLLL